ncbi:unnamed protein product [Acanthoscelides obtectus]|uniref:Neuropeptide F n=1 Tax=Acanthoscelides obtectus TaxID=200917 RepID=A0A9P0Q334_ACAOB|nr:unnamed protein product [Acanthoscelides obtectus]CAK1665390.1 hypothetical protein AOBTE_LOCUS24788 [Acanthoscelides obtectus]
MMRWPTFQWILAFVAVLMIQDMVKAAPNPRGEDMLKELLKLDKMYSSIARPSLRSVSSMDGRPKVVQRAIMRIQELDKLYADRARPRFGKRTQGNADFQQADYDSQYQSDPEMSDWMAVRR